MIWNDKGLSNEAAIKTRPGQLIIYTQLGGECGWYIEALLEGNQASTRDVIRDGHAYLARIQQYIWASGDGWM